MTFANNIIAFTDSPKILFKCFQTTAVRHKHYNLRNKKDFDTSKSKSRFGDMTFDHFFPKLINMACPEFYILVFLSLDQK